MTPPAHHSPCPNPVGLQPFFLSIFFSLCLTQLLEKKKEEKRKRIKKRLNNFSRRELMGSFPALQVSSARPGGSVTPSSPALSITKVGSLSRVFGPVEPCVRSPLPLLAPTIILTRLDQIFPSFCQPDPLSPAQDSPFGLRSFGALRSVLGIGVTRCSDFVSAAHDSSNSAVGSAFQPHASLQHRRRRS